MDLAHAEELATTFMQHHLGADHNWTFKWFPAKTRFGQVVFQPKYLFQLSEPLTLLNTEEHVTDTILHEIAHILAGPRIGHGPEWQRIARSLGARPRANKAGVSAPARYHATHTCGEAFSRNRLNPRGLYCPPCTEAYGGFVPQARITWVDTTTGRLVA